MDKNIKEKKISFEKFGVHTLAISTSTLALFDFLKGEYQAERLLALGWLSIVIGEKRILNREKTNEKI